MKIAVIDYDMGNLRSVEKAFARLGADATVTRDERVIADASRVVLPGVGAFKECMQNIEAYGLVEPIKRVIKSGKPFLGICLGLQLLFDESFEQGRHFGLGVIKGKVERFPAPHHTAVSEYKVPHMGWNAIKIEKKSRLLDGVNQGEYFYFVHSYHAVPEDPTVALTTSDYGIKFLSSLEKENIMACQFHPEKSQRAGLKLLENFMRLDS